VAAHGGGRFVGDSECRRRCRRGRPSAAAERGCRSGTAGGGGESAAHGKLHFFSGARIVSWSSAKKKKLERRPLYWLILDRKGRSN
jgi:hypothetical protein